MGIKRNRFTKIIIGVIVLLLIVFAVFSKLLLSNSSYSVSQVKVSSQLVDKMQKARKDGGILQLNNDELNEIISMYFKGEKTVKGVLVKGVHGEILVNSVKLYIPSTYKGVNFLLTSEGTLDYKDNKITYKPVYFKIGQITLPQSLVISKLSADAKESFSVKDGAVSIDSTKLPLKIKSVEVKNSVLYMGIEKDTVNLEEKLKSMANNKNISELEKSVGSKSSTQSETNPSNTDSKSSTGSTKSTSEMDTALNRVSSELSSAEGSVSTGAQKAVISEIISAVNSMKGNPNANPYDYAGTVRSQYSKLSAQEKAELKAAVFSNVDGNDINIVSSILGK